MKRLQVVVITLVTLLCAFVRAEKVVFSLDVSDWENKPTSVAVAGTFNGWNKDANALKKEGEILWKGEVELAEGVHHYKLVIDGERWIEDPKADAELAVEDSFGGKNSGIMVGPDARKFPLPQTNLINGDGLIHHPDQSIDASVVSEKQIRLRVRTQAKDVESVRVILISEPNREPITLNALDSRMGFDNFGGLVNIEKSPAKYIIELKDGTRTVYLAAGGVDADIKIATKKPFELIVKTAMITPDWSKNAVWYQIFPERFRNGDTTNDPGENWFELLVPWTSDWFAVMPGEAPGLENFYTGYGNVWRRRYGGDIQGIQQKLGYLRNLGVNAIYLNPVFEAESMHKYDTADFRHIDDNFGVKDDNPVAAMTFPIPPDAKKQRELVGLPALPDPTTQPVAKTSLFELDGTPVADGYVETEDPATWKWTKSDLVFIQFLEEAKKQGFHVCIDGVFNHVGRLHPFFQDVVKNGKASKYADWFEIEAFPDTLPADPELFGKDGGLKFKAWDGPSGHLPVFRKDAEKGLAPGPYAHIMAITKRWLAPGGDPAKGIDGIRLDVANDIPHPFWREWRKLVKQTKPDAYISGEIWSEATPWINDGDQFDAVMNYQFAMAAQSFFVNQKTAISPTQFNERLVRLCYVYPFQSALSMMNLFDSHDTDRVTSMFVNPDRPYDGANRIQDNGKDYDSRKPTPLEWERFKQAVSVQMAFVGAPMIYYGNEAGMWSPDDPSNRMPMLWEDLMPYQNADAVFNRDVFDHHRRTIATRQALEPLRLGEYYPVKIDNADGMLVFARKSSDRIVYVAVNRSAEAREVTFTVPVAQSGKAFVDYMNPQQVKLVEPKDAISRPTVQIIADAAPILATGAKITVQLPAYTTAILAEK